MGDPRRLRKKFDTPLNPFEKDRILDEMRYVGRYGLRNKSEFWKHRWMLSHFRQLAREARASPEKIQQKQLEELRNHLSKLGLVSKTASFDDILSLKVEQFLDRRLQTVVYKKGLAKTIYQARQLIVHGHIALGDKLVDSPSYLVPLADENNIAFAINSAFFNKMDKVWGDKTPNVITDISAHETELVNKEQKAKEKPRRGDRRGGRGDGGRGNRRRPRERSEGTKEGSEPSSGSKPSEPSGSNDSAPNDATPPGDGDQ